MAAWFGLLAVASVVWPAADLSLGTASTVAATRYPTVAEAPKSTPAPAEPAAARPRDGWVWPVPEPHQVVRRFDPPEVKWGAGHRGVDLAIAVGGVVRSPADGVVTFVGVLAGQHVVVVAHAGGLRSTFQPVLASVPLGAQVAKGQAVGLLAGSPGHCSPGSCVHWGVLRGEVYLDPLDLLRQQVVLLPLQ